MSVMHVAKTNTVYLYRFVGIYHSTVTYVNRLPINLLQYVSRTYWSVNTQTHKFTQASRLPYRNICTRIRSETGSGIATIFSEMPMNKTITLRLSPYLLTSHQLYCITEFPGTFFFLSAVVLLTFYLFFIFDRARPGCVRYIIKCGLLASNRIMHSLKQFHPRHIKQIYFHDKTTKTLCSNKKLKEKDRHTTTLDWWTRRFRTNAGGIS